MYRFFRLIQKSIDEASPFKKLNISYNKILDDVNREIAYECGVLMSNITRYNIEYSKLSEKEKNLAQFLNDLEYININLNNDNISVNIPVFYDFEISTIIKDISDIILTNIFPLVKEVLEQFEINAPNFTPVRHGIDMKETANELWHQIFGSTNEYLVRQGFVTSPDIIDGQGRFLRSLTISRK